MRLRRLAWAGLEIEAGGQTAVIDLVEDFPSLHGERPPTVEMPPSPPTGTIELGLLTHLHSDHTDAAALSRALASAGLVLRPPAQTGTAQEVALVEGPEAALRAGCLPTRVCEPWETVDVGTFAVSALPAVDGFGDSQVSWCAAAEGCRILHAGDTMFHGWWWLMALRHGPFDAVFLPCGSAVVDLPARQPKSPFAAGMEPREAAVAARLLGARLVVPIHYGPLHEAPNYIQVDDPAGTVLAAAEDLGVAAKLMRPGEMLNLEPTSTAT